MSDPQFLKKITLFAEFDGEELQVLGETVKSSRYLPGDSVLEEGSANRALHILKSDVIASIELEFVRFDAQFDEHRVERTAPNTEVKPRQRMLEKFGQ